MQLGVATYEDLLALPEESHAELIDGMIVTPPPPGAAHGMSHADIGYLIGGPFMSEHGRGGPGGWWIALDVDTRFGRNVLRPDVAGWRRERLASPSDMQPVEVVPDWVCEIVSTNAEHDRVTKRRIYAQFGVPFYWILDPKARKLETMRLAGNDWVDARSYDETSLARIAPFEAIMLEVGRLFPPR